MRVTINLDFLDSLKLEDLPPHPYHPDISRLKKLRDIHFDLDQERDIHFDFDPITKPKPAICVELSRLMTKFMKEKADKDDEPELRAGKMYQYILENKKPIIYDDDLLAGTTTGTTTKNSKKRIGVLLHPDMAATTIWPELETISRRKNNPFEISKEDIETLNLEIFPYWMDKTILERAREKYHNPECQQLMERIIFFLTTKGTAIAHTIPNYAAVVDKGLLKIIEEFKDAEDTERKSTNDKKKIAFFKGVQLALEGIWDYAKNLSEEAQKKSRGPNDEYAKISRVCARVPANPPQTFREAVNAIWICHAALHQESINFGLSLGRLDQVLYPAFKKDLDQSREEGREEEFLKEALELVGCLWLKTCDHVPLAPEASEELLGGTGANQAVTLGGVDREGNDAVNDLTHVMLKATELLRLRDPNINARYHPEKNSTEYPDSTDYLERLCRVNVATGATPCFHNDKATIETLKKMGIDEKDARDYGSVGCVEPESCGRTFGHPGAIPLNLPAVLELTLFQGKHRLTGLTENDQIGPKTQNPLAMNLYKNFQEAFQTQLEWLMDQAVTLNNNLGRVYQDHHPFPMLSALMEGCLENGKDVIQGGAKYNSSGFWIIGLAEVVDSLTAIQKFGFSSNNGSMSQMMEAIQKNWVGYESLLAKVKNSQDKFGTDGSLAKANTDWLMKLLHETAKSKENYRGGHYTVGYYTMTSHAGYGDLSKALPSGHRDKETFPSGITPVSGAAPDLNEVLHFVASLDHTCITNGQALNLKYTPGPATATNLAHCIRTFFGELGANGGLQAQCNIINRETFLDAQRHPENHRDLFVRVSGYSAYFVDLNPKMQEEMKTRAEYDIG